MKAGDTITVVVVDPRTRKVSFTTGYFVRLRGPSRLHPFRDDRFLARAAAPPSGEVEIDLYLRDEGTTWVHGRGRDRRAELRAAWTLAAP